MNSGKASILFFLHSWSKKRLSMIKVREDFCIKSIHKDAYFLDPREQGRLLNDDDKVAAIKFVCKLAEKLSSCKLLDVSAPKISEECALFSAKEEFFVTVFLWKNVSAVSNGPLYQWVFSCTFSTPDCFRDFCVSGGVVENACQLVGKTLYRC